MLTLNEALKYAGLPQRKLDEAKRLSSDEVKALIKNPSAKDKKHLENANFTFMRKDTEWVDERYNDEENPEKLDHYSSSSGGWLLGVHVSADGKSAKITSSEPSSAALRAQDGYDD